MNETERGHSQIVSSQSCGMPCSQNVQLLAGERRFEAVGESDEKLILIAGWGASDDADRAARMHEEIVRPAHFDEGHDLCPKQKCCRAGATFLVAG